jgi:hypothetical protein
VNGTPSHNLVNTDLEALVLVGGILFARETARQEARHAMLHVMGSRLTYRTGSRAWAALSRFLLASVARETNER